MKNFLLLLLLSLNMNVFAQNQGLEKQVSKLFLEQKSKSFSDIDAQFFSPELNSIFKAVKEKVQHSADSIAKSDSQTDKPNIIEGNIFSNIYEGASSYKITKIKKQSTSLYHVLLDMYVSEIPKSSADDKVIWIFKNVDGKWKLDDISYGSNLTKDSKPKPLNLKETLNTFLRE